MESSEEVNEIAAAMAKAQGEIRNPKKGNENPHFKSKYADLATGLSEIRPALSKHGIAVFQPTEFRADGMVILRNRLIHSSGQWIGSTYPVCQLAPHQTMAGALTYARRQSLFALVGVAGEDDDDDGNEASQRKPQEATLRDSRLAAEAAAAGSGALRMFYSQNPRLKDSLDWRQLADVATHVDAERLKKQEESSAGGEES